MNDPMIRLEKRNAPGREFLILCHIGKPLPWVLKDESAEHHFPTFTKLIAFAVDLEWIGWNEQKLLSIILFDYAWKKAREK